MPAPDQTNITFPKVLVERVKRLPLRALGYESPTEYMRHAIREKLERDETRVGYPPPESPDGKDRPRL